MVGSVAKLTALYLLYALVVPGNPVGAVSEVLPQTETLHYSIEWRLITAGNARLVWSEKGESAAGWRASLHMESTGLVSKLFKVDDDYSSTLGSDLCAVDSFLTSKEGRRERETRVRFDSNARKAHYLEKDTARNVVVDSRQTDIPACVHDVLGGLYYLRTLHLQPGESVHLPVSDGKKSVSARVEAQQREIVTTPSGTYKTIRYEAFLFDNVLFRRPAHLHVWLSDDARKLPVQIRVRMQFTIGTITLQLEKAEQT